MSDDELPDEILSEEQTEQLFAVELAQARARARKDNAEAAHLRAQAKAELIKAEAELMRARSEANLHEAERQLAEVCVHRVAADIELIKAELRPRGAGFRG